MIEPKKLDKKELWYKNMKPAGEKSVFNTPKEDVRMPCTGILTKPKFLALLVGASNQGGGIIPPPFLLCQVYYIQNGITNIKTNGIKNKMYR